jgi:hypothetical protein
MYTHGTCVSARLSDNAVSVVGLVFNVCVRAACMPDGGSLSDFFMQAFEFFGYKVMQA